MKTMLVLIVAFACGGCASRALPPENNHFGARPCARFSCPDTPIGNYGEWEKPGTAPLPELKTFRCFMGGTEVIVRGAKNPDPQTCKPVEHI